MKYSGYQQGCDYCQLALRGMTAMDVVWAQCDAMMRLAGPGDHVARSSMKMHARQVRQSVLAKSKATYEARRAVTKEQPTSLVSMQRLRCLQSEQSCCLQQAAPSHHAVWLAPIAKRRWLPLTGSCRSSAGSKGASRSACTQAVLSPALPRWPAGRKQSGATRTGSHRTSCQ